MIAFPLKLFLTIALFCITLSNILHPQGNILSNGGFEILADCPAALALINSAKGWEKIQGSPDYFNICNKSEAGVPGNQFGSMQPHSGRGYAGVGLIASDLQSIINNQKVRFTESMGCKLTEKLKANTRYDVTFYASLADSSCLITDFIHLAFTSEIPKYKLSSLRREVRKRDIIRVNLPNDSLLLKNTWCQVKCTYLAHGGEAYFMIGSFAKAFTKRQYNDLLSKSVIHGKELCPRQNVCYFYIDDVRIVQN